MIFNCCATAAFCYAIAVVDMKGFWELCISNITKQQFFLNIDVAFVEMKYLQNEIYRKKMLGKYIFHGIFDVLA